MGVSTVRVSADGGPPVNLVAAEEEAFWTWAVVHTLRLSGVRIEELLELTHLSIRQYQRPNGEVIGLLVIAPSKTDRERVIPMSAELFHVIAQIIRRLTAAAAPSGCFAAGTSPRSCWVSRCRSCSSGATIPPAAH
ncbi:hypothetical protein ACFY0G_36265 [Streptomyces sp. NPDC001552]|uniref:hypothetical protein n=1 Tax=Streptomyces sp. NPDC001552 TaxID=3364587 RepID=UPI003682ED86